MDLPADIANILAERTHSQVIQIMGKKITLFKKSQENPRLFKMIREGSECP
jgi:RNA-binding protein